MMKKLSTCWKKIIERKWQWQTIFVAFERLHRLKERRIVKAEHYAMLTQFSWVMHRLVQAELVNLDVKFLDDKLAMVTCTISSID